MLFNYLNLIKRLKWNSEKKLKSTVYESWMSHAEVNIQCRPIVRSCDNECSIGYYRETLLHTVNIRVSRTLKFLAHRV